jgi:hypothetical protein
VEKRDRPDLDIFIILLVNPVLARHVRMRKHGKCQVFYRHLRSGEWSLRRVGFLLPGAGRDAADEQIDREIGDRLTQVSHDVAGFSDHLADVAPGEVIPLGD